MKTSNKIIKSLRYELDKKYKPLHTTNDIKSWYKKVIKESKIKIKTIPLNKCQNWKLNKKGFISHSSGSFYRVEGVRVLSSFKREAKGGWDQPMFTEPGYDGGILGLLKKKINNTPHYLINAKFEPGNYKFIQLSPVTYEGTRLLNPTDMPTGAQMFSTYMPVAGSGVSQSKTLKVWMEISPGSWQLKAWMTPYKYRFWFKGWVQIEYVNREGSLPNEYGKRFGITLPELF